MRETGKITLRKSTSTSLLINSHSNLTIMGFISDGIVSHESHLGGYEYHLGGYESNLGCYEFLDVWFWLKMGLDQTGPIREGLGDSHVTVGRHAALLGWKWFTHQCLLQHISTINRSTAVTNP